MLKKFIPDFLALQNEILEGVASGVPFVEVADTLCRRVEVLAPGTICTITSVDNAGAMYSVAAPSMPNYYAKAVDGYPIGPRVGSCGTAAYLGAPVEVADIAKDSLWEGFTELALPLGLVACWSSPIKAADGRVLGTFAFYFRECRGPNIVERQLVDTCVHLCAMAMERAEVSSRLNDLAYHDQLTTLLNRHAFDEDIAHQMGDVSQCFGLLMIDVDHLKQVNDSMGHSVGDGLICEVAKRLSGACNGNKVYRLGGDEFAMICHDCDDSQSLSTLAKHLLNKMEGPYEYDGNDLTLQITIGGALSNKEEISTDQLRKNADQALYHAKLTAKGEYVYFHPGLRSTIQRRREQIAFLNEALNENRVFAHFQPVICMETGKIISVEALARVRAHNGDVTSAGAFAMGLNDSKNAFRVTDCMLEEIASNMRRWLDEGLVLHHVAINLATIDFIRGNLEGRLRAPFEAHNVPLSYLKIEVTENVMMDQGVALQVACLRAHGLQIALDDFGTGFASLSHLKDFPLDYIKIDKSFVDCLLTETACEVIIESLITMAHKMKIGIIAEGVETAEQADRLLSMGCALAQGYHYFRPVDGKIIATLMHRFDGTRRGAALKSNELSENDCSTQCALSANSEQITVAADVEKLLIYK